MHEDSVTGLVTFACCGSADPLTDLVITTPSSDFCLVMPLLGPSCLFSDGSHRGVEEQHSPPLAAQEDLSIHTYWRSGHQGDEPICFFHLSLWALKHFFLERSVEDQYSPVNPKNIQLEESLVQLGHPLSTRRDVIQALARLVHVGCSFYESCNQGLLSQWNSSQCQPMEVSNPLLMTQ